MEIITDTLLEAVFTIVGIIIAAAISYFAPKLKSQLEIIADKDNTGIVSELAENAVELVEARFTGVEGEEKFEEALAMLSRRLDNFGIDFDEETMRMAIQKGYKNMTSKEEKSVDVTEDDFEEGDDEDFSFGEDIDDEEMLELTKEEQERAEEE